MGQLNLPASGSVYLDASVIIYAVEKIDPYVAMLEPLWQSASAGHILLLGSELLLLETLVKPVQNGDKLLEEAFRELLTNTQEVELVPISAPVLERAVQIRATTGLKTPDAIHAATALLADVQLFITNDPVFRRVVGLPVEILKERL
jgi:predicted nucleic acid-binding protein